MNRHRHCCECKQEALIYPYICPSCFKFFRGLQEENFFLREWLYNAAKALKAAGLEQEARSIEYVVGLEEGEKHNG